MSPREVAERARRMPAHRLDAALFGLAKPAWRARWEPSRQRLRAQHVDAPVGFLRPDRAAELKQRLPADAEALLARADELVEGRFQFFGYPEVRVDADTLERDVDPFTRRSWPSSHGKRIDYRRDAPGDPKWIWELNRCQDLPVLAAAWLVSGSSRYAEAARERMRSWIESHPPGRGIAWSNGFEAGIRGISLAATMDAFRGSGLLSAAEEAATLRALWQHARWIERDPSTGSSANNHRIGELAGLVVLGSLAPELVDGERWLELGAQELGRAAERQIRPDGTNVEQAFAYHVFVIDLLLVATAALDCAERPVPTGILDALERSGDALWAQLGRDEPVPTYGDTDDGRAIVLDGRGLRDARGVAAALAARVAHAGCALAATGLDATAWWLFGSKGAETLATVKPAPEPGSVLLPDGGLAILRSAGRRVTLDYGPHGGLSIAAHAHADALALDISLGDRSLVVDPGAGSYFAQPRIREAFRASAFHATVTVDGESSSVAGGPFLWTEHAGSRLLRANLADGLVIAEHAGYDRLDDPVLHRRAVVALSDAVLVVDRLDARGAHRYSQRWPLAPDLDVTERLADRVVARRDGSGFVLAVSATRELALSAVRGSEEPFAGWWSERLESVSPSWLVATDVEAVGAVEIAALLLPFESQSVPHCEVDLEVESETTRIRVKTPHGEETIELGLRNPSPDVRRAAAFVEVR
jgi:hypothetical protein